MLFEGDGGLLFHIQELETLKRYGFRILICAMNDGGYGSGFTSCALTASTILAVSAGRARKHRARLRPARPRLRDVSVIPTLFDDFAAQAKAKSGTSKSPPGPGAATARRSSAGTAICEDFDQAGLGGRIRSWV